MRITIEDSILVKGVIEKLHATSGDESVLKALDIIMFAIRTVQSQQETLDHAALDAVKEIVDDPAIDVAGKIDLMLKHLEGLKLLKASI